MPNEEKSAAAEPVLDSAPQPQPTRQEDVVSKGVWVDTKTSQVVYEEPAEGKQLVSPGTVETAATRAVVERALAAAPAVETATDEPDVEEATDDKTVTSKSVKR
jgi:hypothetical protein